MEIKLNHVSYSYNENTKIKKEVLKDINMFFKSKNIYFILGESGSGKSAILELLVGLLKPTKGKIKWEFKMRKGMVFKNPEEQFLKKIVKDELKITAPVINYKKREEKMIHILKRVGLSEKYLDKRIIDLSQSETKKLALASIILYNPDVFLLDEPTVGLDNKSKDELLKMLRYLKSLNKIIIIVSKDVDFVNRIADYIYILDKGKIKLEGNKYDVFTNKKYKGRLPKIIEFEMLANKKGIKLEYRDDIKDLMKDVYYHVNE